MDSQEQYQIEIQSVSPVPIKKDTDSLYNEAGNSNYRNGKTNSNASEQQDEAKKLLLPSQNRRFIIVPALPTNTQNALISNNNNNNINHNVNRVTRFDLGECSSLNSPILKRPLHPTSPINTPLPLALAKAKYYSNVASSSPISSPLPPLYLRDKKYTSMGSVRIGR